MRAAMQSVSILSKTYPARISAVEALVQATNARTNNASGLREAANQLDAVGPYYGRASTASIYAAFAELIRTIAMLVEWRNAVLNAEFDADRFLRGAKERYKLWLDEYGASDFTARLAETSNGIQTATSIENVAAVCHSVACTPLPIGVFAIEDRMSHWNRLSEEDNQKNNPPPELSVAFLRFFVDGTPADKTHFLTPGETHDLEIEVRVSWWPDGADSLNLSPVSIEPKSNYDFPIFQFNRPVGKPPFRMQQRGRAILKVSQGLQARPFEFKYTASFSPITAEQPIAVVGQRTLHIEGFDLSRNSITGYAAIDRKLLSMRDELRVQSLITPAELNNVLTILTPLCNLAGRALQDALFKEVCDEAEFQSELRNELRRDPSIGSELDEHPHAAGGITDLSYRGIRIELKFEAKKNLSIVDCERFVDQTVSYVVGTGKRIGVLSVLDNSPKQSHGFPAEEGITIHKRPTQNDAVYILTVLIQGNLPRPNDLSRRRSKPSTTTGKKT